MKIGIQGIRASFHDVAARKFFSGQDVTPVECSSFRLLCQVLENKEADFCMMAIENSIAGSILPNYSLLESFGFQIVGETYLRIEMSLLALSGQKISDLRVIQSHPMAILQCDEFLNSLRGVQIIELSDTAESAKIISDQRLKGVGAIASRLAGATFGLENLKEGIETNKQNYTRFLVLCRASEDAQAFTDGSNKASIRFEALDRPGSLVEILGIFRKFQINMTKIQSIPILGKPYQYSFHVDLEWESRADFRKGMGEVAERALGLVLLGEYRKGDRPS